jgi:hypothetical protein
MRTLLMTILTFALTTAVSAATLKETVDRTLDVAPGTSLVLKNVNGSVTVKAWDQPRVHLVAKKEVEADHEAVQKAMSELRVEVLPANGRLLVTTHYPNQDKSVSGILDWLFGDHIDASVQYELTVPRNMDVDLATVNGSIHLADVEGKHELDTTNGKVEVLRCAGSLEASTVNGSIHAELTKVTKGQPMSFETTNGRIEVTVPATLAVDLDAGTTNGSIDTELPVQTMRVSRNSLRGSINGGGTPLRMHTTNGGIAIRTQ